MYRNYTNTKKSNKNNKKIKPHYDNLCNRAESTLFKIKLGRFQT